MNKETITSIQIGDRTVGPGSPCFVIGEIGLNHNGDIGIAKRLIDVAKQCGCDAVKLQKRTVSELAIEPVLNAKDDRFPSFGKTYRQIREHLEFDVIEFKELIEYSRQKDLIFICTPFDIPAIEFLEQFDLPAYKIASHSVTNLPMLERLSELKKPVIMSTGMCEFMELDAAVELFKRSSTPLILLHCVSSYPTPPTEQNLLLIDALRRRYRVPVGYSGHEIGFLPTLIAIALGASVVERHITLDSKMEGFDHKLSIEPDALADMVTKIHLVESMLGTGSKGVSAIEQITRNKYHVSMVSIRNIKAGEIITRNMVTFKNPGTGLPPSRLSDVVGKRAVVDISVDTLITLDQVET